MEGIYDIKINFIISTQYNPKGVVSAFTVGFLNDKNQFTGMCYDAYNTPDIRAFILNGENLLMKQETSQTGIELATLHGQFNAFLVKKEKYIESIYPGVIKEMKNVISQFISKNYMFKGKLSDIPLREIHDPENEGEVLFIYDKEIKYNEVTGVDNIGNISIGNLRHIIANHVIG